MTAHDLSPLMRQYQEIKQTYREAILFFRVGDFYEMFFEDATEASGILNIALTSREKHSANPIPLCGIPHHAALGYIAKLLKHGKNVALCEQVEDPKLAKGLVKREVVRLYTPGTLVDHELLEAGQSSFLTAVVPREMTPTTHGPFGLAVVDLSTGEFWLSEFPEDQGQDLLSDELARIAPKELIHPDGLDQGLLSGLVRQKLARIVPCDPRWFNAEDAHHCFLSHYHVTNLADLHVGSLTAGIQAGGGVLRYLRDIQPTFTHQHIQRPITRRLTQEMQLDGITIRNLEILTSLSDDQQGPTLFSTLDHTMTPMGRRLLRQWIVRPLVDIHAIQSRLMAVSQFKETLKSRTNVRFALKKIQDIERLASRVNMGIATPRDVLGLQQSLEVLSTIHTNLQEYHSSLLIDLFSYWDNLKDIVFLIRNTILPDAPHSVRDGGIIRDGFDSTLDQFRQANKDGKKWIAELEQTERRRTGIDSLKVKYNQVFGYYIEITKSNLSRAPQDYIRKQTLTNAERFTTSELKQLEERVTTASIRLQTLEQELFTNIRQDLSQHTTRIQTMAKQLAILDVLTSFAEAATIHRYVCPEVDQGGTISISDGRHPVIERMNLSGGFIANNAKLDLDSNRLLLITGPNMAGKSTFLRQTGLIILMAQIGSFVPASHAKIGLVDRIYTRVGASDNLAGGQSTFMVEMVETSKILESATPRSLILLDEIGRGTSTYDGLSIAWAVAEFIQDRTHLGARTLFATHYHEMAALEAIRDGIRNYTVSVKEEDERIIFLRKIVEGKADRSYGIHVATLAGLPAPIIQRAQQVLEQLEQSDSHEQTSLIKDNAPLSPSVDPTLPSPHPLIEEVKQIDLFAMTPLDALNRLADFKRRLEENGE